MLDNHPFYMMRNHLLQSFNKAAEEQNKAARKRTHEEALGTEQKVAQPESKIRKQEPSSVPTTSSPQENKVKIYFFNFCFFVHINRSQAEQ